MVLMIVYMILGYWAVGKTIYANKIRIGTASNLFVSRVVMGTLLGWILIPIAIVGILLGK